MVVMQTTLTFTLVGPKLLVVSFELMLESERGVSGDVGQSNEKSISDWRFHQEYCCGGGG